MDKRTKKQSNYNTVIVNRLIEKYGVTRRFITMSLSGDRVSETSDSIIRDYKKMQREINKTLKQL